MNQQGPERSVLGRLWSVVLSCLGLVIVANLTWTLLRPLLPGVLVIGGVVLAISGWNRWRWR